MESRSLWASNAAFLNDATELVYIVSVLDEVVKELDDAGDALSKLVATYADLLRRGLTELRAYDVYVACFSAAGDLLSQWRGYPRAGGEYSLGFNSDVLAAHTLRCVVYDRPTQLAIVRALLAPLRDTLSETDDSILDSVVFRTYQRVYMHLVECGFCFKHPAFEEEAEWRVVAMSHKRSVGGDDGGPAVSLRAVATGLLPYTVMSFADAEATAETRALARVVVGPGGHRDLAAAAAERLLHFAGYPDAAEMVQQSSVPLRA